MTQSLSNLRTASTAIAAVLALSSTAAFAQDAAPVIVLPEVSAAPAPAADPAPVDIAAPASVSTPVVQAVPVPAEPVVAPQAAPATTRAATPARTSAVAPTRPVVVRPVASPVAASPEPAPVIAAAPVIATAPIEAAPAPLPAAEPVTVADNDPSLAGPLLGGAAVLGLGLLGFAAMRRRKVGGPDEGVAVIEKPRVVPAADPAIAAVAAVPHQSTTPVQPIRSDFAYDRTPPLNSSGGAVPLPRKAPQTYEERTALLRRMVEARPDRANPFTARKARARRAKLILQSLDHDFADRDPLFDTSDYPQNWPLVARRKYATAA